MLKLGKKPATSDDRDLKLATYVDTAVLPTLPKSFGHQSVVPLNQWGMFGNDQYGDCVLAGGIHETMMWNILGQHTNVHFSTQDALDAYAAITGFDPSDPNSDQGTDPRQAALYRQKTGLSDTAGRRHKIGAFATMTPGSMSDVDYGIYLFAAVGLGIEFPNTAMDQFNAGKVWDVVPGATIEGGHYIVGVCKLSNGNYGIITWGQLHQATPRFLKKYMDEGLVYISQEELVGLKTPEGFNATQLLADLKLIHA